MQVYYIPPVTEVLPCPAQLEREESHHCIRVLRMHAGDNLQLTDGVGNLYSATIMTENAVSCTVMVNEIIRSEAAKPYQTHVAVAPTKNVSRFEWFLEKATEIGVDQITPLICARSEKTSLRLDRLEKIIRSAALQSLNLQIPKLNQPMKFKNLVNSDTTIQKFVAYVEEQQEQQLKNLYNPGKDCLVLIGPEGDFTPDEIKTAISHHFIPVSLGQTRLRTETAALVAVHTIALLND